VTQVPLAGDRGLVTGIMKCLRHEPLAHRHVLE
jgi:hypothetical protein